MRARAGIAAIAAAATVIGLSGAPAGAAASMTWQRDAVNDVADGTIDIVDFGSGRNGAQTAIVIVVDEFQDPNGPGWTDTSIRVHGWTGRLLREDAWVHVSQVSGKIRGDTWQGPGCPAIVTAHAASRSYTITLSCGTLVVLGATMSNGLESDSVDATSSAAEGYYMATANGDVHAFGFVSLGGVSVAGGVALVDIERATNGYYLLASDGAVHARGLVPHRGDAQLAGGERASAISVTPSGNGYWVFTDKGRVIPFGDAQHFGDMAGVALQGPVLDAIATPSGLGYYMVASDGGVFAFGDARFHGSMGGIPLNQPVQSLVPDPDGVGYWLLASDGGVFAFDAGFRGSMGGVRLNRPVAGMVAFGNGYLMVGEDGGIFNFSDRVFLGSLGSMPPSSPVVSVTA
ncbi:MAG: hypothetical protein ACT4OX_00605 [Actinomycetota bacterium]